MTDKSMTVNDIVALLHEKLDDGAHMTLDSRRVRAGDVFVALKGQKSDGLNYIESVEEKGAAFVLCETRPDAKDKCAGIDFLEVEGLAHKAGEIAGAFYGNPTAHMRGIAVTGTNGKTSTSHWIGSLLGALRHPCAVIGTIGAFLGEKRFEVPALTTPDAVSLQTLLKDVYDAGAQCFAMEASSIGLDQGRMVGSSLETALFTNLTRDHLDYHKTFGAYEKAKGILFDWPGLKNAVINADDAAGLRFIGQSLQNGLNVIAYALEKEDKKTVFLPEGAKALIARNIRATTHGMQLDIDWLGNSYPVTTHVLGEFNVSNLLGVAGVLLTLGLSPSAVFNRLESLHAPKGRLEPVKLKDRAHDAPLAVVDYAHTPDALEKAIVALRAVAQARGGRICAVFGAGGDRDPGKRPIMGEVAARLADVVICTSDNPRSEDPKTIADQIAAGVAEVKTPVVILDRRQAIFEAVESASPNDIVLIAGKGHEDYQEVMGVKHHFDDAEVALQALERYALKRA